MRGGRVLALLGAATPFLLAEQSDEPTADAQSEGDGSSVTPQALSAQLRFAPLQIVRFPGGGNLPAFHYQRFNVGNWSAVIGSGDVRHCLLIILRPWYFCFILLPIPAI